MRSCFEHGGGGGLQFGVGDVVGDFGAADASGEHEGAAAAALLLVGGGERDEPGGVGLEGRDRAVAQDEVGHAGKLLRRDAAAVERNM